MPRLTQDRPDHDGRAASADLRACVPNHDEQLHHGEPRGSEKGVRQDHAAIKFDEIWPVVGQWYANLLRKSAMSVCLRSKRSLIRIQPGAYPFFAVNPKKNAFFPSGEVRQASPKNRLNSLFFTELLQVLASNWPVRAGA